MINGEISAAVVVGAGGHFCPIARQVNGPPSQAALVRAQEAEFPIPAEEADAFAIDPSQPELYFSPDLRGYGWCFRKQGYMNIGIGRLGRDPVPKAYADFIAFLRDRRKVPATGTWRPRGHAYLLYERHTRRVVDDRLLLIGDAAGLAVPQSGEGIRPAIESGVMAAETLVAASGDYSSGNLEGYEARLRARCVGGRHGNPGARHRSAVPVARDVAARSPMVRASRGAGPLVPRPSPGLDFLGQP